MYPLLGTTLLQRAEAGVKHTAGYGLWCLARSLDTRGAGKVEIAALKAQALELGMSSHKYRRAMLNGIAGGMFTLAGDVVYLASLERLAQLYETEVGERAVYVEASKIARAGSWHAAIWSAVHASRKSAHVVMKKNQAGELKTSVKFSAPAPIARATLESITGINQRQQRRLEARAGVVRQRQYAAYGNGSAKPGHAAQACEFTGRAHYFQVGGQVWSELPSVHKSKLAPNKARGNVVKINRSLRYVLFDGADGQRGARRRLYCDNVLQAEKTVRRHDGPDEVFYKPAGKRTTVSGARVWRVFNVAKTSGI